MAVDRIPIFQSAPTTSQLVNSGLKVWRRSDNATYYIGSLNNEAYAGLIPEGGNSYRAYFASFVSGTRIYQTYDSGSVGSSTLTYAATQYRLYYDYFAGSGANATLYIGIYNNLNDFFSAIVNPYHPIYYFHSAGCTIAGQAEAQSGQDVVVTVDVQSGYKFRGASGVKIIDALQNPVPFIVSGNSFSFTMPQAAETGVYVTVTVINENPYSPGGESGESDGGGEFELENSPIPLPELPNLNVLDTGFIKAYKPTLAELQAFQDWIWSDNPFENIWRDILGNPYDYIVGLNAIPILPDTGTAQRVILGNVQTPQDLTMQPITGQYKRFDFGSVNFKEYSNSFLDYAPFTKVTLYLPYVGFVPINPDYVNNQTVSVQYSVDVLTGAFMAFVIIAGKVIYSYSGTMGVNVPTTNQTYNNYLSGIIGRVGIIGGLAAAGITGGLTAPMLAGGAVASAASYINSQKPTLEHGNALTGSPGAMGVKYPYFLINRPMQSIPENIQKFSGFPSNLLISLNDVNGFTKVEHVHLENISATDAEKSEIMSLLTEGVIF